MSAQDLAKYIKNRLTALNMTMVAAAERSKISRQTWHKLLNADIDEARLSTLMKVAETLQTHPLSMLRIYFHGKQLSHFSAQYSGNNKFASGFIADVTYPDNSIVQTGQVFEKIWEVENLGTQAWIDWRLQCVDEHLSVQTLIGSEHYNGNGSQYSLMPLVDSIPIPITQPGEKVRLHVQFRAPDFPCTTISHWKSTDAAGNIIFPHLTGLYCLVKVISL
ncbi:NBR1-Ig-like domain-containing protein [Thiothrix subterranea]|uniref:NBR1-Ig-like domain-containing protein n=2 Tax=Thiothrix subterranea TaxID=2735563 RepID=A0ABU0YE07_9GAMM|nr:NBR1-Ig-like domain-containing protein [Thiothrix subterranea]MDQ5770300.1 NBR1-Ig-like domain-containing protein [Thiothrix subterranea]